MSIYNYVDLNCKKMVHVKIIITWIYLIYIGIINMFLLITKQQQIMYEPVYLLYVIKNM